MKLNKTKNNKGKIHPSPSPSPTDPISNLNNLLPPTILTLISILSLQDKQVLSYMITHSFNNNKLTTSNNNNGKKVSYHKITPSFDCGCFDCYTSYWFLWDSSPNRELIHHAIDAFEEHLALSELQKTNKKVTPKSNRRREVKTNQIDECSSHFTPPAEVVSSGGGVEQVADDVVGGGEVEERESGVQVNKLSQQQQQQQQQQHKGLARKVLPDVIGLFNSRLWNLWNPNV